MNTLLHILNKTNFLFSLAINFALFLNRSPSELGYYQNCIHICRYTYK